MKIKKGFVLREVASQIVVVPVGNAALDFSGIITLNKSGKHLWDKMQEDVSSDELVEYLMSIYDVGIDIVRHDVEEFIRVLKEKNLLDEVK